MKLLFFLSLLFFSNVTFCSCAQSTKEITFEEYNKTSGVFIGTVEEVFERDPRCTGGPCIVSKVTVEKIYKGQVKKEEIVTNLVYSIGLKKGGKYVFFVNKSNGYYHVGMCNRTHLFTRAENDGEFITQGIEEYQQRYKNERKNLEKMRKIQEQNSNGFFEFWYTNGKTMCIAKIVDGRLTGTYRDFLEGGEIKSEGKYIHNKKEGLWKEGDLLNPMGRVMIYSYGNYRNGTKIGEWQTFYESEGIKEYTSSNFFESKLLNKTKSANKSN